MLYQLISFCVTHKTTHPITLTTNQTNKAANKQANKQINTRLKAHFNHTMQMVTKSRALDPDCMLLCSLSRKQIGILTFCCTFLFTKMLCTKVEINNTHFALLTVDLLYCFCLSRLTSYSCVKFISECLRFSNTPFLVVPGCRVFKFGWTSSHEVSHRMLPSSMTEFSLLGFHKQMEEMLW